MGKRSKFLLKGGKSTGYGVCFRTFKGEWYVTRCLTREEAEQMFEALKSNKRTQDAAVFHVVDSYSAEWKWRIYNGEEV
jgi:hypothetical protein